MRFLSLKGYLPYEDARSLQLELLEHRISGQISDTVLFLEHEPVITRGRGLQFTGESRPKHMPISERLPIPLAQSERGGDLTYHGPGQLVVYPIIKIKDIGVYLRALETVVIEILSEEGIPADRKPRTTGVWVGDRKLASIGIAVRKWVTFHGLAINAINDLSPFRLISPCGFSPEVMISLAELVGPKHPLTNPFTWRTALESRLAALMPEILGGDEVTGVESPIRSIDPRALFASSGNL